MKQHQNISFAKYDCNLCSGPGAETDAENVPAQNYGRARLCFHLIRICSSLVLSLLVCFLNVPGRVGLMI